MEYVGEVISMKEVSRRMKASSNQDHLFVMQLYPNAYLDSRGKGSISRFINHSCEPNCMVDRWTVRGRLLVGIFSTRDIQPDEELSFDYQWPRSSKRKPTKCFCGTSSCRGFIEVLSDSSSMDESPASTRKTRKGRWRSKIDALPFMLEDPLWLLNKSVKILWVRIPSLPHSHLS